MMFTVEEIEALVLGARMVESWCGNQLASAAGDVLFKVEQALPNRLRHRLEGTALFVPDFGWTVPGADQLAELRIAFRDRHVVHISYCDAEGHTTERSVRPLGVFFWGAVATPGAWCELRRDFRNFRLDRIARLEIREETFEPEPGCSLQDYYRAMSERHADS